MANIKSVKTKKDTPYGFLKTIPAGTEGEKGIRCFVFRFRDEKGEGSLAYISFEDIRNNPDYFEVQLDKKKMNFDGCVGRFYDNLCIFGKKGMLESAVVGIDDEMSIAYTAVAKEKNYYTEATPDYEETWLSELEYGDVFVGDNAIQNVTRSFFEPKDFCIFWGTDNINNYVYKHLYYPLGVEVDTYKRTSDDCPVFKFKRGNP